MSTEQSTDGTDLYGTTATDGVTDEAQASNEATQSISPEQKKAQILASFQKRIDAGELTLEEVENRQPWAAEELKKSHEKKINGVGDVNALVEALKQAGFATKEDIDAYRSDQTLTALVQNNPELRGKEEAIKVLQSQHPDMAVEDVIEKYGLAKKDKLTLARTSGDVMGNSTRAQTTIQDDVAKLKAGTMTLADFNKKHNVGRSGSNLVKTRRI